MDVPTILTELNEHGFARYASATQMRLLNEVYGYVCGRSEWPFMSANASVTYTSGTPGSAPMPADFLRAIALFDTGSQMHLAPFSQREFYEKFSGAISATGNPILYYFNSPTTIAAWPVPTGNRTLTLQYVKRPNTLLSNDGETTILVPPQFHRALVEGTLAHLHTMAENEQTAEVHRGRFEDMIVHMQEQLLVKPRPVPLDSAPAPSKAVTP